VRLLPKSRDGSDRVSTLGLPVRFTHTQPPPPSKRRCVFLSPANLTRLLSCWAQSGEINEMIWPLFRDRRSRLVYGACSSSLRAKGILRYSQMKRARAGGLLGCWC
jgi:hypothetical protein